MIDRSVLVFLLFICLCQLLLVGLYIFASGFLLTRQVVLKSSSCEDFPTSGVIGSSSAGTLAKSADFVAPDQCWMPQTFDKAIVIIIDALRYDFAKYNSTLNKSEELPYQNKLRVLSEMADGDPTRASLMRFVADAPTTTMQRLKGLTTGSLPTFIDASSNFASDEISEDNIVNQLANNGKQIVFLGDDTWGGLFPDKFHRSFMFPSFNVMDLDSVDNGVLHHLRQEVEQDDYSVLIAHFLGVDHCGHRYGPRHHEMARKLIQMDSILRDVVQQIDNRTLLLVIGDHGMTRTGDHGGDSYDEVTAALFAFSPSLDMPHSVKPQEVSQVDLVPTLALLLGVPVPFSNVGQVTEALFHKRNLTQEHIIDRKIQALQLNVAQVHRYLDEYRIIADDFSIKRWQELETSFLKTQNISQSHKRFRVFGDYLTLARQMCEEVWATFDMPRMTSGILVMLYGNVLLVVVVTFVDTLFAAGENSKTGLMVLVQRLFVATNLLTLALFFGQHAVVVAFGFAALMAITLCSGNYYLNKTDGCYINWNQGILCLTLLASNLGNFSNSYVVVENYVVAFILVTSILSQGTSALVSKKSTVKDSLKFGKYNFGIQEILLFVSAGIFTVAVRLGTGYWKCREEQSWCQPGDAHLSLSALQGDRTWRYTTSLATVVAVAAACRRWLVVCGNANGMRLGVLVAKGSPVAAIVMIAAYWALQSAPVYSSTVVHDCLDWPPRVAYFLIIFVLITMTMAPLLIYELPSSKPSFGPLRSDRSIIPLLYGTLKQKYMNGKCQHDSDTPIVYGLATSLSAPFVTIVSAIGMIIFLLAGDGYAPAVGLLFVAATAFLVFHAALVWTLAAQQDDLLARTLWPVTVWFFLSVHGFYTTGHHHTFSSLHWSAAFVGFSGDWGGTNVVPAMLVGFNTFSSHFLFGIAVPLLLLAPLALGAIYPSFKGSRWVHNLELKRGEFSLVDEPDKARKSLMFIALTYVALHALKVLMSSFSALVLRRHLMVWKIFAPHFLFEGIGLMVTCASVTLGVALFLRTLNALVSWSQHLRPRQMSED